MGEDEVSAYVRHRLTRVDWQGNPEFEPAAFEAVHRHSGGIPRRVNQLMQRVLLGAAMEGAETITADMVEAVAADMGADASAPAAAPAREEKVLPLRSVRSAPAAADQPAPRIVHVPDPALERRLAALEARSEEQEAMLRRVLILLVDWVENSQEPAYRTHAA
jgi:hypothetical protein